MKEKNVVVTGAAGFVGRNVAKFFADKGWNVVGIGLGNWGKENFGDWGIDEWIESEVNIESLMNLGKIPDAIIHCAGSGSVAYSLSNPKEDFEANVSSLLPVLEFMRLKCPNARLVYPSSVAVYGKKDDVPIKENDFLEPVSPYGYHKKIAEELCESYSKYFNLNISIIRFFSIYGQGLKKQLLWDACEKIRNSDSEVEFFGTGDETRDWLHVRDASNLIYKVTESKNKFEVINGASGKRVEIKEILEMLVKEYGKNIRIIFSGKNKKGDPKYYHADISRAKKLGWLPEVRLEKGLKDYVNFYKANT